MNFVKYICVKPFLALLFGLCLSFQVQAADKGYSYPEHEKKMIQKSNEAYRYRQEQSKRFDEEKRRSDNSKGKTPPRRQQLGGGSSR
ncbi:MAG: hypothetical protein Q8M53_17435 [Burkholderiales bacterium]|nr:hypothetical protein [Burkholderiales bacterium]